MADLPPYPPIDPTTFDLIVIGTGLPESIISAAASTSAKSVLHVDPNPFYGSHFSSLSIPDLTSFLNSNSSSSSNDSNDFPTRPLYSEVDISNFAPELLDANARKFNLDLSGPRVLFCADKSIDLLLKSGASQYLEFKSIDVSFVGDGDGKLWSVPDSRAAIFKDKSLGLIEKNQLMRFFKLVQGHLAADESEENNERISPEDLESPFIDFLTKMKLPPKIKSMVLYAIAMTDYDQEKIVGGLLKTKHGINRLALYSSSVGRFQNALGALIYPIYGQGELPQAFCRKAAVKGCLYVIRHARNYDRLLKQHLEFALMNEVSCWHQIPRRRKNVEMMFVDEAVLRMPVISLLMDEDSGSYKGVRLASGQDIFSSKLILDPSFTVPKSLASTSCDDPQEIFEVLGVNASKRKVARGICITRSSLRPDVSNCLVVYPPRSLFPEQVSSIRVVQLSSNVAVCPPSMFVLYFSALCDDANQGKKLLHEAMNALLRLLNSGDCENSSTVQIEETEEVRPSLLWSALYIQEVFAGRLGSVTSTPTPDGNLNYGDIIDASEMIFKRIFPDEEFFPETTSVENSEDDAGLTLET